MFKPQGVYPAMPTPFTANGDVDEAMLRRFVDYMIDGGLHGLFPVSTTGEGAFMDYETKCQVMRIVVEQAAGRVPVTPGIVAGDPRQCVKLAGYAKSIGCQAVVATPPFFFKPEPDVVELFLEYIADHIDMPLILYNIPWFAQPLTYGNVERLTRKANVVGMKDSSGSMVDFVHFMAMAKASGRDVALLTGREDTFFACLCMGAEGCMTATASVVPEAMVAIYDAFKVGDRERARSLQFVVNDLIRVMAALPFPEGYRLGLEVRGLPMGPTVLPLSAREREARAAAKTVLEKMIPDVLRRV
jgi:dihydrodipicolinate synthase/N-acetylneuraminate lyase